MLERIKEYFRNKIEKVAESIYWRKYKREAIERYRGGFHVSIEPAAEQQLLDYLIRWAGKKDPIERFLNALREIGIEISVDIRKLRVLESNPKGFRIEISLFEGSNIFLELSGDQSIVEIQHNHCFERKLVYDTSCWRISCYEYETCQGTHVVKRGDYCLTINGVLNETENYEFSVRRESPFPRRKCLYWETRKMANTIESALNQEISAYYVQNLKIYPIYKIIEDSVSSVYNVTGCTVSISALKVSATFLDGKLLKYKQEDGMISIDTYGSYVQKDFCTEDGEKAIFENKQYKIVNVQLEKAGDVLKKAKEAFDKIESLDF